jgi:fluoroacetyl-CoA thioesterase
MKAYLQTGLRATHKLEVGRGRNLDFMGEKARVYANPMLVLNIETACRRLILERHDRFIVDVATAEKRLAGNAAKVGLA